MRSRPPGIVSGALTSLSFLSSQLSLLVLLAVLGLVVSAGPAHARALAPAAVRVPAAPAASPALAQSAGAGISVRVVNGTPGGGSVSGLPVAVYQLDSSGSKEVATGETGADGTFSTPELSGDAGATYVVSTTYEGVAYRAEPVGPLPAPDVVLRVYEPGGDEGSVKFTTTGIVILEVDPQLQRLRFLETATLHNSGERTFVPSTEGPRGPMGLLRFGLPDGAGNLAVGEGLADYAVIQVDTGFATDMPVSPGDTNVSFTYEMAYGALSDGTGYAQVNKTFPYPVDLLRVLAVSGDFTVESAQLTEASSATIGERTYRQYEARDLPARTELAVELRHLPLVLPALRTGNGWLQAVVGVLLLAAVALPFIYRRVHGRSYAQGYALRGGQGSTGRALPRPAAIPAMAVAPDVQEGREATGAGTGAGTATGVAKGGEAPGAREVRRLPGGARRNGSGVRSVTGSAVTPPAPHAPQGSESPAREGHAPEA